MGKTGKWLRNFLTSSKKEKEREKEKKERNGSLSTPLAIETRSAPIPVSTPKEKRRWSFRRPAIAGKDLNPPDLLASAPIHGFSESDMDQKKHAMAVAVATAAATDAAVAEAQAAAAVIRLTTTNATRTCANEESAAIKIQAAFRSHLARKALRALKGLVKLQALVRGHLVRNQATATLRCMQALVAVQARVCAQRIQMLEEAENVSHRHPPVDRRSPQHPRFRQSYVSNHKFSAYGGTHAHSNAGPYQQVSPAPSALTNMSPRACSGHFEDFSFTTAQSSPHYFSATSMSDATKASFIVSHQEGTYSMSNDYPFFPSYMANTESSRAKARSQSAPKQRPDTCERQPSRRRPSLEGRNIPRSVRMQRSSSHAGASVNGYQYPWSIKLDKSNVSLKDSECGSTSTVLTNTNYCRSLMSLEVHGKR